MYGLDRVDKAVLIGTVPPFLLKTADNPEGVDGQVFEGIKAAIVQDRYAYFGDFFDNFYNTDTFAPDRISDQALGRLLPGRGHRLAVRHLRVRRFLAGRLPRRPKIDVPVLAIHGTADRILPFEATAGRLAGLVTDLRRVSVEGGPHNICWTHHEEVNQALLEFLAA
ncbi:alpha/beta fold hydrolase [Streptomyces sp. CA-142005]|uniref:alpha/beta fold hydrolase n=1 Tax=Streptomyces sp. CA-142005 TaxID=3240052 RepID=UPI003D9456F9